MKKFQVDDTLIAISPLPEAELTETKPQPHARERATVKALLERLGLPSQVDHHPDGSPFLPGFDGYISISHSRESVAIALNPHHRIGIDTETWRPQLERVKHKFLSTRELEVYQGNPGLLLAWCMKEAAYKAAGIKGLELIGGIHLPDTLNETEILIPPAGFKLKTTTIELTATSATILCTPI
ncbi:MAG: 4'-phosphopantetheinyl transferase superfamily protein [Bacteroidales bacterium]|nr:4'-phosphopantetheinyl transferase superfamily protein [Bacteroidales bacterium]